MFLFAIYTIYRSFWKFNESIPFLGGEVLRAEYRVGAECSVMDLCTFSNFSCILCCLYFKVLEPP